MDLRSLRYFIAAAEQLHFGRAAEKMHIVQSAISQQIKRLEDEIGLLLFERVGNEVLLTEAGRQMLPACRKLLRQVEETVRFARSAGNQDQTIRFAFVDNAISALLPALLQLFRSRLSHVDLVLKSMDRASQIAALDDRTIDVGLMPEPLSDERFVLERFISAPLVIALPMQHPLTKFPSVGLSQLEREPFVLFPASMRSRILETILAACATANFTPRVVEEATQIHTLLALVDAGVGVTLVPSWAASSAVHDVAFRRLHDPTPTYSLALVRRADTNSLAVSAFMDVARNVGRTLHASLSEVPITQCDRGIKIA